MKKISQTEIQHLMSLHQRGLDDEVINKANPVDQTISRRNHLTKFAGHQL